GDLAPGLSSRPCRIGRPGSARLHAEGGYMPTRPSARLRVRIASILVLTALALFGRAWPANADTLRGRAVDPHARAIAGADVAVLQGPTVILCAKTRSDGQFGPFDLPAGEYD